jgi:hypothetical protein
VCVFVCVCVPHVWYIMCVRVCVCVGWTGRHKTGKGIYMKFRGNGGVVSNVTYENIVMDQPQQWPIWIGIR